MFLAAEVYAAHYLCLHLSDFRVLHLDVADD